jgi:hypothetical protein
MCEGYWRETNANTNANANANDKVKIIYISVVKHDVPNKWDASRPA